MANDLCIVFMYYRRNQAFVCQRSIYLHHDSVIAELSIINTFEFNFKYPNIICTSTYSYIFP